MALDPHSPEVRNQRRAVMRLVLVAGVILVMTLSGKKAQERRDAAQAEAAPPPPVRAAQTPAPAGPSRTWSPGSRTSVPRPVLTRTGPTPATAPAPGTQAPGDGAELDDDAPLREALSASLEAVVPQVRDCLHQWWMIDPNLAGTVELEFVLDRQGLGEVEVLDHTDVPVGPLSCFATALFDAEWPQVASEITVVQPFRFEN